MAKQTKQKSKAEGAPALAPDRDDEFRNEHQIATEFNFSVAWLRAKRLRGTAGDGDAGPPYYRIGRKISYRRGDVREYLEAHKVDRSKNAPPAVRSQASA